MLCHPKNHAWCLAIGILVLRVALGVVFIAHGWMKLAGGPEKFAGLLTMLHVPLPLFAAWVVTLVEFVGGIAVLVGAATRIASTLIAIDMFVALVLVHWQNGFFISPKSIGYEFVFTLTLAALALVCTGAGRYSLDAVFCKGCHETLPIKNY